MCTLFLLLLSFPPLSGMSSPWFLPSFFEVQINYFLLQTFPVPEPRTPFKTGIRGLFLLNPTLHRNSTNNYTNKVYYMALPILTVSFQTTVHFLKFIICVNFLILTMIHNQFCITLGNKRPYSIIRCDSLSPLQFLFYRTIIY